MSKITEEMVEAAAKATFVYDRGDNASGDEWDRAVEKSIDDHSGELPGWIIRRKLTTRAALEAVAPMIRNAALEEAAKVVRVIEDEYRRHAGSVPQTPPQSYAQAKANAVSCVESAIQGMKEQP